MKAKKFEDLYVWRIARELVNLVYQLTKNQSFLDPSLKDQIRRASVSIMSNIAEGFERGTKEDLIHFLYIARASSGEVRTQGYIALDQKYISVSEFNKLKSLSEKVSSLLYRFIESIKVSKYKGLKFKKEDKEQKEFEEYLKQFLPKREE